MARLTVDNSGEIFGAKTSIADLAQFSFADFSSDNQHIYEAAEILERDWSHEMEAPNDMCGPIEMEYATGVSVKFKDGSRLSISAWADCCRPDEDGRYTYHCHWCGNG